MIIYNMRNRGSLEYDKFIYNIFQYCNYVKYYSKNINSKIFNDLINKFNIYYHDILNQTDEIYNLYIAREEK